MTDSDAPPPEEQPHDQDDQQDQKHRADADVHASISTHDPGPLYQLCVAPDCPYDFAYRFDGSSTHHFHYVGPPSRVVFHGDPSQDPPLD